MLPLLMLAAATAQPVDYRKAENWLCRPGREDVCSAGLLTRPMTLDGTYVATPRPLPVPAPAADCFYVYPTVSLDPGANSDMAPGVEERGIAAAQFSGFRDVCRTFAPLYRQVTMTALRTLLGGGGLPIDRELPYADVRAAWRDYLARDNNGRPFVLIGHSQGSMLLKRLVAQEIDGKPAARRMLSAILPGTMVEVPAGQVVGGDFKSLPLCRADDQTGCILSWASYRDAAPPPANALFGKATTPGMIAACTNPAALGGGSAPLGAILGFPWWQGGVAQYRRPEARPDAPPLMRLPDLLSGECRVSGAFSYLSVHVDPKATGLAVALTSREAIGDTAYPEWGWHVVDIGIVQADLVRLVGRQAEAWRRTRR